MNHSIILQSIRDYLIEAQLMSIASDCAFGSDIECILKCLEAYNQDFSDYGFESLEGLASALDVDFYVPSSLESNEALRDRILEEYPSLEIYF